MRPRNRLAFELGAAYLAAWLTGVGFGYVLARTNSWKLGAEWERGMLTWIHDRPLPTLFDRLMLAMPYLGTNLTMLPLVIAVGLLLWLKYGQRLIAVQLVLVSVGSLSLNPTMKYLLDRPRPALFPLRGMWTWASYPSGHLILTTALYFTASLVLDRIYGWKWPYFVSVVVILLTAYSRVYLSVHWPTDLIGGFLIGLVWLFGTWTAFARYRRAEKKSDLSRRNADRAS
ncbi:MAG: phosphatase PAP2 family protein [Gemmatimonadaceae bacterium]